MKQILMKAREVGADAIMIIGQSGPYGEDDALSSNRHQVQVTAQERRVYTSRQ